MQIFKGEKNNDSIQINQNFFFVIVWEIALHFPDNKIMLWFVCGDLEIILIDKMKIESGSVVSTRVCTV